MINFEHNKEPSLAERIQVLSADIGRVVAGAPPTPSPTPSPILIPSPVPGQSRGYAIVEFNGGYYSLHAGAETDGHDSIIRLLPCPDGLSYINRSGYYITPQTPEITHVYQQKIYRGTNGTVLTKVTKNIVQDSPTLQALSFLVNDSMLVGDNMGEKILAKHNKKVCQEYAPKQYRKGMVASLAIKLAGIFKR
jgi:hypothetical protein